MSWIKENYEKAALGGAAAILLGVVGVSVLGGGDKLGAEQKKFTADDATDVPFQLGVAAVLEERSVPAEIEGKVDGPRPIDLFVGQALYMKDGGSKPIDLYESESVHAGIPNLFWQKYGINPTFANAADRDFDKDGFSNIEEHQAGTDPSDKSAHPSPISKLVGRDVDLFKMQIRWSAFDEKSISLTYRDNKSQKLRRRVEVGASFFAEGSDAVKGRFVLEGKKSEVVGPNGRAQDAYEVTDTAPRYKGTEREKFLLFKKGAQAGGYNEVQDRSVTFTLNALGQESEQFTLAENERFSLPYDASAKVRPYKIDSITPTAGNDKQFVVTVSELIDGKTTTKKFTVSNR